MKADLEYLTAGGVDVVATTFEGGHEWTPAVNAAAARLLDEIGSRG